MDDKVHEFADAYLEFVETARSNEGYNEGQLQRGLFRQLDQPAGIVCYLCQSKAGSMSAPSRRAE